MRPLSAFDEATEVPPLVASGVRRIRPYLFSKTQIRTLLAATRSLYPRPWGATKATFVGLLAATGLRPGEAYRLDKDHVDLRAGEISVIYSKLGRSRLLPIHPTTVAALRRYARQREKFAAATEDAFFLSPSGRRRIGSTEASLAFREILTEASIAAPPGRRPPRPCDLRHSFAVNMLIDWHRAGVDVQRQLPVLSAYLGHLVPANTYWYLQAAPELLAIAARRLGSFEGLS